MSEKVIEPGVFKDIKKAKEEWDKASAIKPHHLAVYEHLYEVTDGFKPGSFAMSHRGLVFIKDEEEE